MAKRTARRPGKLLTLEAINLGGFVEEIETAFGVIAHDIGERDDVDKPRQISATIFFAPAKKDSRGRRQVEVKTQVDVGLPKNPRSIAHVTTLDNVDGNSVLVHNPGDTTGGDLDQLTLDD